MRRPRGLTDQEWAELKCDRAVRRGIEGYEARISQDIRVGGAKVISSYRPTGEMVFRRTNDPCTFDKHSVWPKVFRCKKDEVGTGWDDTEEEA